MQRKILILAVAIFCINHVPTFGQSSNTEMTYKGKAIGKRKTAEFLAAAKESKDPEIQRLFQSLNFEGQVYMLDDGRLLDYEPNEKIGNIWPGKEEYVVHLRRLAKNAQIPPNPRHVLSGMGISQKDFPNGVPALTERLNRALKFDVSVKPGNLERLDVLQSKLHDFGISKAKSDLFLPLVAFCGEVMRIETGGKWELKIDTKSGIYEPYILLDSGRTLNPWLGLFKEFEENPDNFNLRTVVESELTKYVFIDAGLESAKYVEGIRNIPVEEAMRLLEDSAGEVDHETKSLMESFGMDGLPIRLPDGKYLIRQSVYHLPIVPQFESKEAIENYLRLQMRLDQLQNHIPKMYSLEEAMLAPELVRHLHLTVSDLESRTFNPSIFSNLEYLAVTNEGWTVFPPVGIDMDLPVVNWSILSQFTSLKTLNLSGVPIASLPKQILELRNLETLQILYVQPRNIGREISRLQQLRKLKVLDLEGSIFELGQQGRIVDAMGAIDVVQSSITLQDPEPAQDRDE